jgi:WD40 repeat protein
VGARSVSRFTPDGARLLIVAGADLVTWDVAAGRELGRLPDVSIAGEPSEVEGRLISGGVRGRLVFSPGLGAVASIPPHTDACGPLGVRVSATGDGRVLYEDSVSEAARFSPDGGQVALLSGAGVRVVDLTSGAVADARLGGYRAIALSPRGGALAAARVTPDLRGGAAAEVELWDLATGELRSTLRTDPRDDVVEVGDLRFTQDGSRVAALVGHRCEPLRSFKAVAWDTATGEVTAEAGPLPNWLTVDGEIGEQSNQVDPSVAFAPDGRAAAWTDNSGQITLWRPEGDQEIAGPYTILLSFSGDGRLLAAADNEGGVRLFSLPEGRLEKSWRVGPDAEWTASAFGFSPDGSRLITPLVGPRGDAAFALWELPDGRLIARVAEDTGAISLSADNELVAVASYGQITFYDGAGGALRSQGLDASDAVLAPDRRLLATLTRGMVVIWGARLPGRAGAGRAASAVE